MEKILHQRRSKQGKDIQIMLEAEERGQEIFHWVKAMVDGEQLGYANDIAKLSNPIEGYTHRIGKVVVSQGTAEAAQGFLAEAEQINAQRRAEREYQGSNKYIRAIHPENGGVEYRLHYDNDGGGYGRCLPEGAVKAVLGNLDSRERVVSGWWYNYPISQGEYEAILAWQAPETPHDAPSPPPSPQSVARRIVPPEAMVAYRRYQGDPEKAWEAGDEAAWALIREYEVDIERTYIDPDKARKQMAEARREERFGLDEDA